MDVTDGTALDLVVGTGEGGVRLDLYLAERLSVGRRAASRLAATARVNGRRTAKGATVREGDRVRVRIDTGTMPREGMAPRVLCMDAEVLVLAKPRGLPTVSIAGRPGPSVACWLADRHPECRDIGRPGEAGLAHRLDTETSGLLLAARTGAAYASLRAQFRRHEVVKAYFALVVGRLDRPLEIASPIGQHRKSRTRVRVVEDGRSARYAVTPAVTQIEPVEVLGDFSLVEARTRTGARHQVRVHLAHVGHPLVADHTYGGVTAGGLTVHRLHASTLRWTDPAGGECRSARCDVPDDWNDAMQALRRSGAAAQAVAPRP